MVEYAIILVLVAVVVIGALSVVGNQVSLSFQDVQAYLANPTDAGGDSPYPCPGGGLAVLHGHRYHCP